MRRMRSKSTRRRPNRRAYKKRRLFYKRQAKRVPRNRLGGTGVPIPNRLFCKLKYHDTFTLTPNSGGGFPLDGYIYRTSLYDPDYTNMGHQPIWRDQMASLFEMYRVHGIKYRLRIWNTNTAQGGLVAIQQSNAVMPSLAGVDFNTVVERPYAQCVPLNAWNTAPKVVKGYMPTGRPWGLTKQGMKSDEDFEAAIGSNPAKMSWLNIYAKSFHTTATYNIEIQLVFMVEFFKRYDITGS